METEKAAKWSPFPFVGGVTLYQRYNDRKKALGKEGTIGEASMAGLDFLSLAAWLKGILADSFKKYLILTLGLLGLVIYVAEEDRAGTVNFAGKEVAFFYNPLCPHCQRQKEFNPYLKEKYPQLKWVEYDTSRPENVKIFVKFIEQSGNRPRKVVPTTFVGPYVITGFDTAATTGVALERAIMAYLWDDPALFAAQEQGEQDHQTVELPLFGEINSADYSLLSLAVILGLVDGFNPCAMWVLLFLLSLLVHLHDRRRMALIAGTFVFVSGAVYYAFMAAWLNVFLLLGMSTALARTLGALALVVGALNVKDFVRPGLGVSASIPDAAKPGIYERMRRVMRAEALLPSLAGVAVLAVAVNFFELLCTAGFPAIYTAVLAQQGLGPLAHYAYLGLYIAGYIADDALMVGSAVFALSSRKLSERAGRWLKLVSGGVMLALGATMILRPEWLR